MKRLYAVRGATCTEDSKEAIIENVCSLYKTILEENHLTEKDLVSIQFTTTPDIKTLNPCAALRRGGFASSVPLFCSCEPVFEGSLEKVVRVLIHAYSKKELKSFYLNGAQVLRPDLSK